MKLRNFKALGHNVEIGKANLPRGTPRAYGIGITKNSRSGNTSTAKARAYHVSPRRRGPAFKMRSYKQNETIDFGSIGKQKLDVVSHNLHFNKKKVVIGVGATAGVGLAAYGGYKVYKHHQAKKNFEASLKYHRVGQSRL